MSGSEFERENIVAETLSATAASKPADRLPEVSRREHDWRPPAEGPLDRKIFTAVRRGTGERPAHRAVREALAEQAAALGLELAP